MTAPIPADIPNIPAIPGMAADAAAAAVPPVPAYAVVPRVRRPLAATFRALIALTATAGVAIELITGSPLQALSHFTIQSGILAATVSALSAWRAWTARRPLPPSVIAGTLLYVVGAGLVHHVILSNGSLPLALTGNIDTLTGWPALSNQLLHTVLPIAAALDWLLLTRPGPVRLRDAAVWLLFPLAYLTFALTRGALLPPNAPTRYPYPFLDAPRHGYVEVLTATGILSLACYTLALLLIALDHIRPSPRHRPPENRISPPATGGLK
ncbi:integral membrane regulator [Streptomyces sp. HC44]|uniref:Integral membrane regulator n=1 Tax=Streptomyces scabichelini TaxID=2711217 RepID=A0A6G4VJU7_9ACTN|nr:integral membrane regulator [Streptomyces scabichelini]